jgi:hypothetical protein
MVLIPMVGQVQIQWLCLQINETNLFGFLLYTNSDRALVDYMSDGVCELDFLSTNQCAIFVIEAPSKQWIEYTRMSNHIWWRKFGQAIVDTSSEEELAQPRRNTVSLMAKNIVENNQNCTIVIGEDNKISLQQLLVPINHLPFDRTEALAISRYFNLQNNDIPCLVFFRDVNDSIIWKSRLGNLRDQQGIKEFFRNFFDSSDFQSLLSDWEENS